MNNIYPNCYDIVPKPTNDNFILFRCDKCLKSWLASLSQLKQEESRCPFCGKEDTIKNFYQSAYLVSYQYYHMVALKNLLSLIGINVEFDKDVEMNDNHKYQVKFLNVKEPNEKEMNEYVKRAYEELKKRADDKSLAIQTKVYVSVQDMVDLDEFMEIKTPCCKKSIRVKKDDQNIMFCIYCKEIIK